MKKMIIEIENVTEAEARTIEHMMALWQRLGDWGSSRWVSFFADGDGVFRPKIMVNGKKPRFHEDLSTDLDEQEIKIDFDTVWDINKSRSDR